MSDPSLASTPLQVENMSLLQSSSMISPVVTSISPSTLVTSKQRSCDKYGQGTLPLRTTSTSPTRTDENQHPQRNVNLEPDSPHVPSTPSVRRVFVSVDALAPLPTLVKSFKAPSSINTIEDQRASQSDIEGMTNDDYNALQITVPKESDEPYIRTSAQNASRLSSFTDTIKPSSAAAVSSSDYDSDASTSIVSRSLTNPIVSSDVKIRRRADIQSLSLDSGTKLRTFRSRRSAEEFSPVFLKKCLSAFDSEESGVSPELRTPDTLSLSEDQASSPTTPPVPKSYALVSLILSFLTLAAMYGVYLSVDKNYASIKPTSVALVQQEEVISIFYSEIPSTRIEEIKFEVQSEVQLLTSNTLESDSTPVSDFILFEPVADNALIETDPIKIHDHFVPSAKTFLTIIKELIRQLKRQIVKLVNSMLQCFSKRNNSDSK